MTEQVTRIIRRAKEADCAMPYQADEGYEVAWLLWIISDSEAYWIHAKTDKVVASSRNY